MDTSVWPVETAVMGLILMKQAFNTLDMQRKPKPLARRRLYAANSHKQWMVSPERFQ
jgi:hypothetical protein